MPLVEAPVLEEEEDSRLSHHSHPVYLQLHLLLQLARLAPQPLLPAHSGIQPLRHPPSVIMSSHLHLAHPLAVSNLHSGKHQQQRLYHQPFPVPTHHRSAPTTRIQAEGHSLRHPPLLCLGALLLSLNNPLSVPLLPPSLQQCPPTPPYPCPPPQISAQSLLPRCTNPENHPMISSCRRITWRWCPRRRRRRSRRPSSSGARSRIGYRPWSYGDVGFDICDDDFFFDELHL